MRRTRVTIAACALAAVVAGAAGAMGSPRVTLLNAALLIDYPWRQGVALLSAAGGLGLLAWAIPRRWARIAGGASLLVVLGLGVDRLTYRLEVDEVGLATRSPFGDVVVRWPQVSRVESGDAVVVVWGVGDQQVRIPTSAFRPEQRAMLDRSIARRVREQQPNGPR